MPRNGPNSFLNYAMFINADVALVTCPRCGNGFERLVGRRISCLHRAWSPAPGPRCRCQGWRCPDPAAPAWDHTLEFRCPQCGDIRDEVRLLRPDHLAHLEEFIGAWQRPRKEPGGPHDPGHSPPRWMLLAMNRAELLRALTHLRDVAAQALAATSTKATVTSRPDRRVH